MNKLLAYGTLREGRKSAVIHIPGRLYNLGWFPGLVLDRSEDPSSFVTCEVLEVDDDKLRMLDSYEGYDPDDPENSLYIREKYDDFFVYTINKDVSDRPLIESGDWLDVQDAKTGALD